MKQLLFATTNRQKLASARVAAKTRGYEIMTCPLEIDEIQGEDAAKIALDKADKAFKLVSKPVIVSDDSWAIHCLNGFPGAYMKSVTHWFTTDDFLRLTSHSDNRQVTLTQMYVYQDASGQKLFQSDVHGQLLLKPQGDSKALSWLQVVSLDGDNGLSVAKVEQQGPTPDRAANRIWYEIFDWLENQKA
jgi:non-canonical purine NTP pyrophosphatase (RdgB/HAM1 family)